MNYCNQTYLKFYASARHPSLSYSPTPNWSVGFVLAQIQLPPLSQIPTGHNWNKFKENSWTNPGKDNWKSVGISSIVPMMDFPPPHCIVHNRRSEYENYATVLTSGLKQRLKLKQSLVMHISAVQYSCKIVTDYQVVVAFLQIEITFISA